MVSTQNYGAARHRVAYLDRSDRGRIIVSGADRRSYLQGLLTNDIAALKPGRGCYAAYLTAQGRMIADPLVYELGDIILLSMAGPVKDTVLARLNQFIFSEDVQLADATGTFAQLAIVGPGAAAALAARSDADVDTFRALPEHGSVRVGINAHPAIVTRITDTGEPGYDVFQERAQASAFMSALRQSGVPELDEATADALRIEAGIPRFGSDMDEETIPLEAGIESRAIDFNKGCYVGQEVIIRVLHRGHGRVARKLIGLTLDAGEPPAAGATIRAAEREVGVVTSSTLSPALGRAIALGYAHRDFVAPGTELSVNGVRGQVTRLPFVRQ